MPKSRERLPVFVRVLGFRAILLAESHLGIPLDLSCFDSRERVDSDYFKGKPSPLLIPFCK